MDAGAHHEAVDVPSRRPNEPSEGASVEFPELDCGTGSSKLDGATPYGRCELGNCSTIQLQTVRCDKL